MLKNNQLIETDQLHLEKGPLRKPYLKPHLGALGDLRGLTLGGSFGIGESGSTTRKVKANLFQTDGGVPLPDGSILLPDGSVIPPGKMP